MSTCEALLDPNLAELDIFQNNSPSAGLAFIRSSCCSVEMGYQVSNDSGKTP
jgi:hypothetical protein